jgi:hypothetical protein
MYLGFFWWDWAGLPICKAGALPLEPHLQFILLWLFGDGVALTICLDWPQTVILLISVSQVARIIDMSHWCPARI